MAISKKGITLFYAEKGAANIENTTFAAGVFITIQDFPDRTFAFRTLCVLFSPLARLKMLMWGGGALFGFNVRRLMSLTCKHDNPLISVH